MDCPPTHPPSTLQRPLCAESSFTLGAPRLLSWVGPSHPLPMGLWEVFCTLEVQLTYCLSHLHLAVPHLTREVVLELWLPCTLSLGWMSPLLSLNSPSFVSTIAAQVDSRIFSSHLLSLVSSGLRSSSVCESPLLFCPCSIFVAVPNCSPQAKSQFPSLIDNL